jgi:hypothetical protein
MGHKITITVPDELYQTLVDAARQFGLTPEEAALERLKQAATSKRHRQPDVDEGEKETRVETHFGTWDSGDMLSADNERIDADLAREYASARERK